VKVYAEIRKVKFALLVGDSELNEQSSRPKYYYCKKIS